MTIKTEYFRDSKYNINSSSYNTLSYSTFSKIHQMTAYLAMFPPSLPNYFIENFSKKNDLVFDPFSGRGTTIFEACRLGRIGIGNDLNPLAVCLTKAKANLPLNIKNIHKRINELEKRYIKPDTNNISEDIKILYDEETTLAQLIYLKKELSKKKKIDNFILAILTGLMHGKQRKDGSSIYCSIDMPNTFSMSPNYIKNFVKKHGLTKPKQNVFNLIKNRVETILKETTNTIDQQNSFKSLKNYVKGYCFNADAIKSSAKIKSKYGKESVKLIVTSPPYLKVINYGKYNWIRLWLLDEDIEKVDKNVGIYHKTQKQNLSDNLSLVKYALYMQDLFNSWNEILKKDGYAFVVIGDVNEGKGETLNLAQETWNLIQKNGGCKLNLMNIITDNLNENGEVKVTKIWGNKKGKATEVDRIMILKRRT
ncbi:DNA methyltransferase [Arcobacter sp. F2176]|uniref:DNA methyltransferase n=1 Tax=Arcobacter sp. F2176 TaxID=2044511 RepID=UPI00100BA70F|nr:DNA methyltransferase [Arcobacter sp. F2176]RXJ81039.1 DNA modification methylase [Arcobacter sp. F2176]